MAVLKPTGIVGRLVRILINADHHHSLVTQDIKAAHLCFAGMTGDSHATLTRPACARTKKQYEPGTAIRNVRQLTLIGLDELATISSLMQLPAKVEPQWLGANMVVDGIPELSLLPPGSRLIIGGGASVVVDMENEPCRGPAKVIDIHFPGYGKFFVKAAVGRRGVTGWVEREGDVALYDSVALHCPPNRLYPHFDNGDGK